MLYHELKSHYFLYLVKHGSWDALLANVLEPSSTGSGNGAQRPKRKKSLRVMDLRYDRGDIDHQVSSIDSATVRPRYQSDLLDPEDRERFDRAPELARVRRTDAVPSVGDSR